MSELGVAVTALPQKFCEKLTCIQCNLFLSIPPIVHTSEGYQCGRCTPKQDDDLRATAYETLARTFLFPCKYESLGCTKCMRFDDVQTHENDCEFRTLKCPQSGCKSEIKMGDVLSHFERQHQEFVMTTNEIAIGNELETRRSKIIKLNDDVLLLEMFVSQEYCCWLTLSYFEKLSGDVFYKLEIKSEDPSIRLIVDHQKILKYSSNNERELLTEENIVQVKEFKELVRSDNITLTILPENTAIHQPDNRHVLEELECFVCQEYMTAPIYACTIGHTICSSCESKLEECPLCKSKYEDARNFALERLSERNDYPCKNQANGCKYVGSVAQIRSHESSCLAKLILCPLAREENCCWRGVLAQVYKHSKTAHPQRTRAKLNEKMFRNLVRSGQNSHVVTYDNNVFKISVKYDASFNFVCWTVGIIGGTIDGPPSYCYTVRLMKKTGALMKMREFCFNYSHANEDEITPPAITLPISTLVQFVDNQRKLIFSIDISKITKKKNIIATKC